MKRLKKKKTQNKNAKIQQEPFVFNGALVGTCRNSDVIKITFDSGIMIVKYGNNEYAPSRTDLKQMKKNAAFIAKGFGISKNKVVVLNGSF